MTTESFLTTKITPGQLGFRKDTKMEKIQVKLNVTYSDGFKKYLKEAKKHEGLVVSGFGNGEILSETGCWEIEGGINGGWIYFDGNGKVLEEHTDGHVSMKVEFI